jgi:HD-like signal output (HDOD) protein/AmiR/NasT family two-component response regulator
MDEERLNVLFVDDEPNILAGMRRMLRPLRHEWNMTFVQNGYEALQQMDDGHVDVVVTDMRMPGMDGATLLQETALRQPHTIRFVLSGQSDHATILRAISATHQFLAKPCDADVLKTKIRRAALLRNVISDTQLKDYITQVRVLPSPSGVCHAIVQALACDTPDVDRAAQVVADDPALSLKVLQVVNSGLFGHQSGFCSVRQAAGLVGLDVLQALVESADLFDEYLEDQPGADELDALVKRSHELAGLAGMVATEMGLPADRVRLAGFLRYAGDLIALACCRRAAEAQDSAPQQPICPAKDHAVLSARSGAYLLALWGFDEGVALSVLDSVDPEGAEDDMVRDILPALHIAEVILRIRSGEPCELNRAYLARNGVEEHLAYWTARIETAERRNGDGAEPKNPVC